MGGWQEEGARLLLSSGVKGDAIEVFSRDRLPAGNYLKSYLEHIRPRPNLTVVQDAVHRSNHVTLGSVISFL